MKDDRWFYSFRDFEAIRESLKKNTNPISFRELGAGSKSDSSPRRTVSSIAKNALSYPYQCRVMFRLVEHLGYRNVLELGTSLGISSLYLGSSSKDIKLYTLEGDPGSHSMASHLFKELKMSQIQAILGPFAETLNPTLQLMKKVDLAFIDGHHDKEATLDYFQKILPYCESHSAIIIDDIYWSDGMTEAWEEIKNHPEVSLSINLFFCGIVFFRKENKEKEHFKIRPHRLFFHK